MTEVFDVIIIGGGPAGLNAAVVLGRCRRNVIVFDTGKQRNRHSHGMHNYLTRDDIKPGDFLHLSHKELRKYKVHLKNTLIVSVQKSNDGSFIAKDTKGNTYRSKKLLLATGLTDTFPPLENFETFYGKSIFHCPYCDGWEVRDKKIGVYARNKNGFELAMALLTWSKSVSYFSELNLKDVTVSFGCAEENRNSTSASSNEAANFPFISLWFYSLMQPTVEFHKLKERNIKKKPIICPAKHCH